MKETYPAPKAGRTRHLSVVASNAARTAEYGDSLAAFEERIFRGAICFNVVRFGVPAGSECQTTDSFPRALWLAHQQPRTLIYVVSSDGRAFCMSHKDYGKFALIWQETHK